MTELDQLRKHCLRMANARPGESIGVSAPRGEPDHIDGAEITDADRALWRSLAAQIATHQGGDR